MYEGRIRLRGTSGEELSTPREWTPALIDVDLPVDWREASLRLNGVEVPLSLRRIGGAVRTLADWPRSGPGRYRLHLVWAGGASELVVTVPPSKMGDADYSLVIEDLETRLPLSIALGLQQLGGLAGVTLVAPREATLASEVHRLRVAVRGDGATRGLDEILRGLKNDPHRMLQSTGLWVRREHARRPDPNRVIHALLRPGNLSAMREPLEVSDSRVEHSVDVYENRLVRSFVTQVDRRLRRLLRALESGGQQLLGVEVNHLIDALRRAKREASFLEDVAELTVPADRLSMVLLRRPEYRAALEGFLRFQRGQSVRIDDPALDAPLEQLPYLYQLWCTLHVIDRLLAVAAELGYRVSTERLLARDSGGFYLRPLPDGKPAVELSHPKSRRRIRLIPERSYAAPGAFGALGLHSLTFLQRPDIAIELMDETGDMAVYLFDPKYKLDGEGTLSAPGYTAPLKVDIDKMHAYRDAIRGKDRNRAVRFAAILYPGETYAYPDGIEAIGALPSRAATWLGRMDGILTAALGMD